MGCTQMTVVGYRPRSDYTCPGCMGQFLVITRYDLNVNLISYDSRYLCERYDICASNVIFSRVKMQGGT